MKTVHTSGLLRPAGSNPHPVMLRHFLSQSSLTQTAALAELSVDCSKRFRLKVQEPLAKIISGHRTSVIQKGEGLIFT